MIRILALLISGVWLGISEKNRSRGKTTRLKNPNVCAKFTVQVPGFLSTVKEKNHYSLANFVFKKIFKKKRSDFYW